MGVGMGLTMSPMSTAAMNAVDQTKAGVASGILSMSRMVGGTFGVAALGALVAALGRSKLEQLLPAIPSGERDRLVGALGSGAKDQISPTVADATRRGVRARAPLRTAARRRRGAVRRPGRPGHARWRAAQAEHEPLGVDAAAGTPATRRPWASWSAQPEAVLCRRYGGAAVRVLTALDADEIAQLRGRGEFFWLDLHDPSKDDLAALDDLFGLNPLAPGASCARKASGPSSTCTATTR